MSTTTIRLPQELKERVAKLAEQTGKTSHAIILDAIAQRMSEEEQRNEFYDTAEKRYAEIIATGKTIPWIEMRAYLEDRSTGETKDHPTPNNIYSQNPSL